MSTIKNNIPIILMLLFEIAVGIFLLINPEITALVQEQEAAIDKAVTNSRPGARWTQLSTVEPTNDDVRRILADNPFAPFAIPLGLGIAVAGGLEKLLAFRREID